MKGETIVLVSDGAETTDAFGRKFHEPIFEHVDDVIIGTPSTDDAITDLNLEGKRLAFVLGIPKGDEHDWKDKVIYIRGEKYRTYGFPLTQTEANVPLRWNTQVKVERYE